MPQKIEIPDSTFRALEELLAEQGGGDISEFVNRTLQKRLFFDTVSKVQKANSDASPEEMQQAIDEAVDAIRAENNPMQED